jgi:hypothetical protein
MWQDVIALTVVAVTVALTVRATVRSSARASNSACGDCHGCAVDPTRPIPAESLRVFSPSGGRVRPI